METSKNRKTEYGLWFDLPFIIRTITHWFIPIVTFAIVVCTLVYIGSDKLMKNTYTGKAIVSVVPRDNTAGNLSDYSINNAVTRNVNMWNSNTLLKAIEKNNPDRVINGTLSAAAVEGTTLVEITVTSDRGEDTFYLLNSALQNFHQVENNFDTIYYTVLLTHVTEDSIVVTRTNPILFGILGFIGVLCAGFGLLILWTMITDVIHSEIQAEHLLEVPVYESLVRVKKKRDTKSLLLTKGNLSMDYMESLDKLTSRVEQHAMRCGYKRIMVASINENEGKSTVAANLALSLAKRGRKVLLVDMDLRKPSIYKIFDQEKKKGNSCSDIIIRQESLANYIEHKEELYNLDILWQYQSVKDSDQLLENPDFMQRFRCETEIYDFVIVDTSPMGPVRDGDVVAQMVDCSLLVIRQDQNHAAIENDVTDQFGEFDAPCMGVVLNYYYGDKKRFHKTKRHSRRREVTRQ